VTAELINGAAEHSQPRVQLELVLRPRQLPGTFQSTAECLVFAAVPFQNLLLLLERVFLNILQIGIFIISEYIKGSCLVSN
jgi:hypothetical protein